MNFKNFINNIKQKLSSNIVIFIFTFFVIIILILGLIYISLLSPSFEKVQNIINKYKVNNYEIPYFVAERYITWYNMRTYFFSLHYMFNLCSLFASFMTIFYASKGGKSETNEEEKNIHSRKIIFLSLVSTCFTVSAIFIKSESMAYMSQHAWRQLDNCIMETVSDNNTTTDEKNNKIISKIIEMEQYIESYEH